MKRASIHSFFVVNKKGKPRFRFAHYLRELQARPYVYGTDTFPGDAGTTSLQTGRSIRDPMIAAGRRVRVIPRR